MNKPFGVKYMAICVKTDEFECNRTQWKTMRVTSVNDGQLLVFASDVPENTAFNYKLKMIFQDLREIDTKTEEFIPAGREKSKSKVEFDLYRIFIIVSIILACILMRLVQEIIVEFNKKWSIWFK